MDYYLKATDEQALFATLAQAGVVKQITVKNEAGKVVETRFIPEPGYDLDVIGTIYKPTGNMVQRQVAEMPSEVPEMVAVPGFHANLRGPVDLAPVVTTTEYQPTKTDLQNPDFVMPEPTKTVTPSPIQAILVDPVPTNPVRVWF